MEIRLYQFNGHLNDVIKDQSTLTHLVTLTGELRNSLSVIDPVIVVDFSSTANITFAIQSDENNFMDNIFKWNYAYISAYRRYYFIRNITLVSKNIIAFQLHVDVLKTYRFYITEQHAYISRNENEYNIMLPDERRIVKNTNTILEFVPTNVPNSLVNTEFETNPAKYHITAYLYWLSAISLRNVLDFDDKKLITNPEITNRTICSCYNGNVGSVITFTDKMGGRLVGWCFYDNNIASFVGDIVAYPFNLPDRLLKIFEPTQQPDEELVFINGNPVREGSDPSTYVSLYGVQVKFNMSDELVIADFTVDSDGGFDIDDFNDLEPYSTYQIYIPYYGWWDLPFNQIIGKRILVYYIVNFKNGSATVQVWNKTDDIMLFSTSCQLGTPIEKSASNYVEVNDRARQNDLNLILSLLGTGLSVGGGLLTGNPVAIGMGLATGGVNIGKSLAQYTESNRTNYPRAHIGNTGNVTPLFNYQQVMIRKVKSDIQYQLTSDFLHFNGGVLNEERSHLYDVTGYTEIGDITFENIEGEETPLQDELNEIISLLKSGVYL